MLNSCCTLTMVSVSSIADQLCKQKLEDGWSNSEPEKKKSVLSLPGCLTSESDNCEAKAKALKSSNFCKDSKFNNNVWLPEENEIETDILKDTELYRGQIEQMPPKKKHCRSFSMPREAKSESGSGFRKFRRSQSSLSADVLRPVAVRPRFALGLQSASKANRVMPVCCSVREDVPESNLNSDNSYPISGPCSDFYDYSVADSVVVGLFQSELCQSRVAYSKEAEVESDNTFQCTTSCASDILFSSNGMTSAGNELFCSPSASLVRSRSSALSNIDPDPGNLRQGSCVANPRQHQTPQRKTCLKRRRDEDRPKLDFFKMIETAYENDLFSSSISQQTGSRWFSKDDVSLSSVSKAQSVESSSPCPQLDSNNPCRISPASPFISLHRHFLAEKVETAATGDDDAVCFTSHDAAINHSQKNWMNRTHDDLLSEDNHVIRNQVVGSEFDLDLIENN